ncbi:MAG: hypothetical protein ACLQSR_17435 [Limisphaerales bacterium]
MAFQKDEEARRIGFFGRHGVGMVMNANSKCTARQEGQFPSGKGFTSRAFLVFTHRETHDLTRNVKTASPQGRNDDEGIKFFANTLRFLRSWGEALVYLVYFVVQNQKAENGDKT